MNTRKHFPWKRANAFACASYEKRLVASFRTHRKIKFDSEEKVKAFVERFKAFYGEDAITEIA